MESLLNKIYLHILASQDIKWQQSGSCPTTTYSNKMNLTRKYLRQQLNVMTRILVGIGLKVFVVFLLFSPWTKSGGATYVNTRTIRCTNQRINTHTMGVCIKNRKFSIFLYASSAYFAAIYVSRTLA